jgi:hypothetical protein
MGDNLRGAGLAEQQNAELRHGQALRTFLSNITK